MLKENITIKIKEIRRKRKISQKALAEIIECKPAFVCDIEHGRAYYNLDHIELICKDLDYPVAALFDNDIPVMDTAIKKLVDLLESLSPVRREEVLPLIFLSLGNK